MIVDQVQALPSCPEGGSSAPAGAVKGGEAQGGREFARVLDACLGETLRFSRHAQARLASREIPLSDSQRQRLAEATRRAELSGAREALLLMGNTAFIVSVPNRMVITALEGSRMEAGVITGIDTAVMVPGE